MDNWMSKLAAVFATAGSFLIATKLSPFVGFCLYLCSSMLLIVWSLTQRDMLMSIVWMQLVFTVMNAVGIAVWWPR